MRFCLQEVARSLGCDIPCSGEILHVCQDSRLVTAGTLFFALKGKKVNGEDFLAEVAKRGAIAAIVSAEYRGEDFRLCYCVFPSVTEFTEVDAICLLQERG